MKKASFIIGLIQLSLCIMALCFAVSMYNTIQDIKGACLILNKPAEQIDTSHAYINRVKKWVDSMDVVVQTRKQEEYNYNHQPCNHEDHFALTPCSPMSCVDTSIARWCRAHNIKYE